MRRRRRALRDRAQRRGRPRGRWRRRPGQFRRQLPQRHLAQPRRLRENVEADTGLPFADGYQTYAEQHGALRIDEQFTPYPGKPFDDATYTGDAYPCFGWAACVAEVDVDLDTGEVTVTSAVSADDVGHAIHPVLAEGQVEGGTLQAVGYATIEEIKLIDGRYLNDRLATYLIPTALDAPRITSILVEKPYSGSPHGAKGIGGCMKEIAVPAFPTALFDHYCPICGVDLVESDYEAFDKDYGCPSCGTQQRPSRAPTRAG